MEIVKLEELSDEEMIKRFKAIYNQCLECFNSRNQPWDHDDERNYVFEMAMSACLKRPGSSPNDFWKVYNEVIE